MKLPPREPVTLRAGVITEIESPTQEQIGSALDSIERYEVPVVSAHRDGESLEIERISPGQMLLHFRTKEEWSCSGELVETAAALRTMAAYVERAEGWFGAIAWRRYVVPYADEKDLARLLAFAEKTARDVERTAAHLSERSREWILRRLLREKLSRKGGTADDVYVAIALSELEHYLLQMLEGGASTG